MPRQAKPKVTKRSETSVVKACLDWLNSIPGCHAEKQHGSMFGNQRLDILLCFKGQFGWIEVKRPGEVPTKLQDFTMGKWRDKGGAWCIWTDSLESLKLQFNTRFGSAD